MIAAARIVLSAVLFLLPITAQTPAKATASIAGRISIGAQPAAGVEVVLKRTGDPRIDMQGMNTPPITAKTDAEGRYRIANLLPGTYRVAAYAPAYVIEGDNRSAYQFGKIVTLSEGESAENVDFNMVRGGVITGRVTDENGKPVVFESVGAFRLDAQGKRTNTFAAEMMGWQTDDRGIYRIYGLDPGRYVVGAGASREDQFRQSEQTNIYQRTYHPETTDEKKAAVVELKPGTEAEHIDIKLSSATKGYVASGRVVEGESGQPIPGISIIYVIAKPNSFSMGGGNSFTNSNGEFQFEGLSPNTYIAFATSQGPSDFYLTNARFEVVDKDIGGLEIKRFPGGVISGTAVVEGTRDPSIGSQLSKIRLWANRVYDPSAGDMWANLGSSSAGVVNANGSFRVGGIQAGRVSIQADPESLPKGFTLFRIERGGVEIKDLEISNGEQITGVRLIFGYGAASVVGRVQIKGGTLPANSRMSVYLLPEGAPSDAFFNTKQASVDERGQFLIEAVAPGSYLLRLEAFLPVDGVLQQGPVMEQKLTVSGNDRQEISLVLDLTKKAEKQ